MKTGIINNKVHWSTAILLSIFLLAMIPINTYAQNQDVEALRVGYMTDYLQLTPKESQGFWPIYNEYRNKVKSINKQLKANERASVPAAQKLETKHNLQQQKIDIEAVYEKKFAEVLPLEKVAKIAQAENAFKIWLLDKIKNRP